MGKMMDEDVRRGEGLHEQDGSGGKSWGLDRR